VHTTQFAIRDPKVGLLEPVLRLAAEEVDRFERAKGRATGSMIMRIGGICGEARQAVREAELLRDTEYHAGLLSLGALKDADEPTLLDHCRAVGEVIPLIGFYLQPSVGGRVLPFSFWRRFAEDPAVVAIKIAPFNRYQTLDVVRAVAGSGRTDIALYTGNDDNIVADLVTPYRFSAAGTTVERRVVGGLLGQWAVGTRRAVQLLDRCHATQGGQVPSDLLRLGVELMDTNAALFDAAHRFAGCIAGIHEVLREQRLMEGIWCLDERECLSPGQHEEINRVRAVYPHLHDDQFVEEHRDEWLSG
jgi:hypothetical protein